MSALPQFPAANDPDALETQEWLDALEAVLEREGPERAHFLLERLIDKARRSGAYIPFSANTAYVNTIPPHMEERSPGNVALEERIRSICRWNAMVLVAKANKSDDELGGHIASFASVGTLFGTGQQHFWNAPHDGHGGDLIYFQGHSSPGVYATIAGVVLTFFFLHYFFASITAHTATLFPLFLAVAIKIPVVTPVAWALLLAYIALGTPVAVRVTVAERQESTHAEPLGLVESAREVDGTDPFQSVETEARPSGRRLDVGQGLAAVDLRLPLAQHVEIGPVEHQHRHALPGQPILNGTLRDLGDMRHVGSAWRGRC